jgi:hypothetical protein
MLVRIGMYIVFLTLVVIGLSCAKIPEWETPGEGVVEELKDTGAIPSQWGNVIAVTNIPTFKYQFQLWLQDEDGIIRLVNYSLSRNKLLSTVRVINRK